MDFAIIETGGKQYKITPTSIFDIERLQVEAGEKIVFDKVLMIVDGEDIQIGTPYIDGAAIEAVVENNLRGKKIHVIRFRHKSRHRRHNGHRQELTKINMAGKVTKKETVKSEEKAAKSEVKVEKVEKTVKAPKVAVKKTPAKTAVKSAPKTAPKKAAASKVAKPAVKKAAAKK